jgi:ABC-type antimicrobial peptide transport system permease subunit
MCSVDTTSNKTKEQIISTTEKHGNSPSSSSISRNSLTEKGNTDLIHGNAPLSPFSRATWIESFDGGNSNKNSNNSANNNINNDHSKNDNNSINNNSTNNSNNHNVNNQETETEKEKEKENDIEKDKQTLEDKKKDKDKDQHISISVLDSKKAHNKEGTKSYDLFSLFDQAKEQFNNDVRIYTSPMCSYMLPVVHDQAPFDIFFLLGIINPFFLLFSSYLFL